MARSGSVQASCVVVSRPLDFLGVVFVALLLVSIKAEVRTPCVLAVCGACLSCLRSRACFVGVLILLLWLMQAHHNKQLTASEAEQQFCCRSAVSVTQYPSCVGSLMCLHDALVSVSL